MRVSLISGIIFVLSCPGLFGQTEARKFSEADDLFLNNRFAAAMPLYLNFLKSDSSNVSLHYKVGVCYLNSRSQKGKAVRHMERAVSNTSPVIVYKFLGDAYHLTHQYDLAIASYEKFEKIFMLHKPKGLTIPKDISLMNEVSWKIEMCLVGKKLNESDSYRLDLNSCYRDYTSALSLDQAAMTFTFHRPDAIKGKSSEDGKYFEEIYIPVKPSADQAKRIIDTTSIANEFTVATSIDGQIVLTYRDDRGSANLCLSRLKGNQWTSPEKLSRSVNLNGWEFDEFISSDGYTLYFTSDRAGGFGGKDIYKCKKSSNGEWGKAINLGPAINSPFDEEAPFIYSDEHTLYFSSNKAKLKCCFDVFSSTLSQDGSWSEPLKVGYPIKTSIDDVLDPVTTAYQEYSPAAVKAGAYDKRDLYRATFVDEKKTPFIILKGKAMDINGKVPRNVKITITDNQTAEVLGIYNPQPKTGDYALTLSQGGSNNITFEADGYVFHSETVGGDNKESYYETHKVTLLSPLAKGSKIILNNIFFDFDRASLRSNSNVELHRLFLLLSANPDMKVELAYYVNPKENNKFFIKLAQERAQAVANYLIGKGINKERVIERESGNFKGNSKPKNKKSEEEEILGERLKLIIIEY